MQEILRHPYFRFPKPIFNAYVVLKGFLTGKFTAEEASLLMLMKFKNGETHQKFIDLQMWGIEDFINPDKSINLYGKKFYGIEGDVTNAFYLIDQIIHQNQYRTELIKDGDVVIDAGANRGVFSVKVAHEFPNAKIYAFEPVREVFLCLKKNTEGYPNIFCFESGLGDVTTSKQMIYRNASFESNRMVDADFNVLGDPPADEIRNVPVVAIDDFAKKNDLPRVDFIKMDTEGYEGKIIQGAAETIRRCKSALVMSAYHSKSDKEELPRMLARIQPGYRTKLEKRSELDLVCRYPQR